MKTLILILLFGVFYYENVHAKVGVTDFYLEFERAVNTSSPNLPVGYHTKYLPAIGFNVQMGKYFYGNTEISSEIDETQFRYVAMDNEFGFRFEGKKGYPTTEVYFNHFSGHVLDDDYGTNYPFQNTIGVRLHLGGF